MAVPHRDEHAGVAANGETQQGSSEDDPEESQQASSARAFSGTQQVLDFGAIRVSVP